MNISDIVEFWKPLSRPNAMGQWVHPDDEHLLTNHAHSFNLDFPVSPFVGDILEAPVIILGLNAGYNPAMTPTEFKNADVVETYLQQVSNPHTAAWTLVSDYYKTSNSWRFMRQRKAAWINASPYRSPNLSQEKDNQKLAQLLPSTIFHNRWMQEAVLPLARNRERLIAVKRKSLWNFLKQPNTEGISECRSYVGKHLDNSVIAVIEDFLNKRDGKK